MKNHRLNFLFLLLTIAIATPAYTQVLLSGTVKSVLGEPLPGANVIIMNSTIGTYTDAEGVFKLEAPAGSSNAVLAISLIGYNTEEVIIGDKVEFSVILTEDLKMLNEVVVTGYQTEERGKILGSVSTVSPELLTKIPVSGIDQALQGRVPGVVVSQNTGAPGEGVSVRIRGLGSINSSNTPLYIIDGIPTQDATSVSPQDILTISVLKDASASAIYGSRAANGVVLITTKIGTNNKQVIQFNSQIGFQQPTRLVPMATTDQYVSIYNEAVLADTVGTPSFLWRPLITDDIKSGLPNVNQVKAIMRPNALLQTHSLSISGGEGKTKYFISGNYYSQDGIIKASDYKRITGRINVESQVKKWLKTGVNLNVSTATTDLVGSSGDGAGGNGGSVLRYAYFRSPAIPIRSQATGDYTDKPSDNYNGNNLYNNLFGDGYNPVGMLAYNNNKRIADRLFGKVFVTLNLLEGLSFTSNVGVDYTSQNQRRFDRNWGSGNRINNPNRLTVNNDRNHTLTFSNFINYNKTFGDHNFTVLLGTEAIKASNYSAGATDMSFANQSSTLTYLNNGIGVKTLSESQAGNALLSFFGKIGYDYNEKYLASVTLRRDGSSRFGPNNRWGNFYAGSLGWRIDKESFLQNNSWIDKLLLRAGYGVIGNQEIPNYAFSDEIGVNNPYSFGNTKNVGYAVSKLGNANIKWESSSQLNAGVDLAIWNGKLLMSLDYFNKVTSSLLVNQPIASSAGLATAPIVNNGKVLNRGLELALNYSDKIGAFTYTISPNAALLHNEVLSVDRPIAGGAYGSQYTTLTEKGYQIGSFYMLEMEGIFQNQSDIFTHANQGGSIKPGDVKFKDQDGSGTIDYNKDRAHVGSAIPKVTGGLNIALGYKNFDLSVFFQGAYGQKILSVLNRDIEGFYRPFNVTERYYSNHWTPENPSNQYPRASWSASGNNAQISTRFLESGSYTRLKNLQLGYTIPKSILEKFNITALRIYFSGANLLTFTKYSGMDPEMTVSDNSKTDGDKANGIDWGTYPAAKSYNFGVNVTF
ncbi:MAG TPA: TonB-dependent receptor [Cyclobacteriaceae bacterium]|nr:TonB-dependent receptor [Cyclobacteriaceae bacterium]